MAINFPDTPTPAQQFTVGDTTWTWDGVKWNKNATTIQGVQGLQGPLGTQGTQGLQGLQGVQGTQGIQGLQGAQGVQGTQGPQGTQGLQGLQGNLGTQGTQGVQGLQGVQGPLPTGAIQGVTSISDPDYIFFDTTPEAVAGAGSINWDDGEGSLVIHLKGGNVTVPAGTDVTLCFNGETTTLNKGEVVYLYSAQGQRPAVKRASNLSDATSAKTFGIVAEAIGAGAEGWVINRGVVSNVNTGAYNEGDILWLASTPGTYTVTKPYAPNHMVFVGVVLKNNASSGRIYVAPQNGYEMEELHNVQIQGVQDGQVIAWNAAQSLWKNTTVYGMQGTTGTQGAQGTAGYIGADGTQGTQGVQGRTGLQGFTGTQGTQGLTGQDGNFGGAAFDYFYSTNTSNSNPGSGYLKFDNTDLSLVTTLYIHNTDHNSVVATNFLETIDDSTSAIKGHFSLMDETNEAIYTMFAITGYHTYTAPYYIVPVSYISGNTSLLNNEDMVITFARTGDKGDTGAQGTTGTQGATGTQGTRGLQGTQGLTGSQGTTGTQGSQGTQGVQGTTGSQGTQGIQGNTGTTGLQGIQGTQGLQGVQGIQGALGTQGVQGLTGPSGVTSATAPITYSSNTVALLYGSSLTTSASNLIVDSTVVPYLANANTFTNQQQITVPSASTKGLIVKAAASQTADLQQWQNSTGTVLAEIDSAGAVITGAHIYAYGLATATTKDYIRIASNSNTTDYHAIGTYNANELFIQPNTYVRILRGYAYTSGLRKQNTADTVILVDNNNMFLAYDKGNVNIGFTADQTYKLAVSGSGFFNVSSASAVPITLKGAASQTANLTEWQDSTGQIIARVNSAGAILSSNRVTVGTLTPLGTFTIIPLQASDVASVIRGAASQTGDLTQWQNSAGTLLALVDANGVLNGQAVNARNTVGTVNAGESHVKSISPDGNYDLRLWMRNDAGGFWYNNSVGGSAGVLRIGHADPSRMAIQLISDFTNGTSANYGARVNISTVSTGVIGLAVRGVASQTANLQEWQNSVGTLMAYISPAGAMYTAGTIFTPALANTSTGANSTISMLAGGTRISTSVATNVALTVRNLATTPTANLQEWQDTAGTVLSSISSTGAGTFASLTVTGDLTVNGTTTTINSTTISVDDKNIELGSVTTPTDVTADGGGITLKGATDKTFNWVSSTGSWTSSEHLDLASGKVLKIAGTQVLSATQYTGNAASVTNGVYTNAANTFTVAPQQITIDSATNKGFIIKAAPSQSTSLTEWQDSSGGLLAYVRNDGLISAGGSGVLTSMIRANGFTYGGRILLNNGGPIVIDTTSASVSPLVVKATTSQSANIQEWQNTSGGVLGGVASGGGVFFVRSSAFANTAVSINTGATSNVGIVIRGETSQTADMQQWQDSGANVLGRIDSTGGFQHTTSNADTVAFNTTPNSLVMRNTSSTNGSYNAISGLSNGSVAAAMAFRYSDWTNSYGQVIFGSRSSSGFNGNAFVLSPGGGLTLINNVAATPTLVVKGAASQSANLQEWRDSTDALVATLNVSGQLRLTSLYAISSFNNAQVNMLSTGTQITSNVAANVTLSVKAAASQSANITEWQNSAGTALVSIDASGNLSAASANAQAVRFRYYDYTGSAGAYLDLGAVTGSISMIGRVTTTPTVIVKGVASQTANLQEWQSSAGTVLSSVNTNGTGTFNGGVVAGGYAGGSVRLSVMTLSSTVIGAVIKGAASQTADLQQWQNDSGTVIASMSASGAFSAITKSFDIPHPTKPNMRLRYGSLEGPENGVYVRGRSKSRMIELPEHWLGLVDPDTITVTLTPIGKPARLFVKNIDNNVVTVGGGLGSVEFFYTVFAERKDVDRLTVEY